MDRRTYLTALATLATTTTGCLGDQPAAAATAVRSTTAPSSSTLLTFQEWYQTTPMDVTVTNMSTINRLRGDSTPTGALPDGAKLVLVSALLKNATDESVALADTGVAFGVVASDQLFEPVTVESTSELSSAIATHADAPGTYLPVADGSLQPEEQRSVWQAVLVPEELSIANAQVALCGGADCGIRWEPSGKTCDCPG